MQICNLKRLCLFFRERRRKGKRERDKHTCETKPLISCLPHMYPSRGPGLKPRHVPWPGIELVTLCLVGWFPTSWVTPVQGSNSPPAFFFLSVELFIREDVAEEITDYIIPFQQWRETDTKAQDVFCYVSLLIRTLVLTSWVYKHLKVFLTAAMQNFLSPDQVRTYSFQI